MQASGPNLTYLIARCTRWLQARFPQRPVKGLTRFSSWLNRWLLPYAGVFQLEGGVKMYVDSRAGNERWILYSGNYQPAVTHILKQHIPPGSYCLDIGANLGFYTISMAHWVGPQGHVTAFEANPAMVKRIAQNVALNRYQTVNIVGAAVNNEPGNVEFFISENPGKSSLRQIRSAVSKIVVPGITIDEYVSGHPFARLDVIKLDVEGNDCQALLGGSQTLARFRPFVLFEYKHTTTSEIAQAAFALLANLDYQLWSLSPTGNRQPIDPPGPLLVDADIVCVSRGAP